MVKKRRRNYFFTFILIIFFWTNLFLIIFFIEPKTLKNIIVPNSYLLFFLNLFFALFFTLAIILANSRKGFLFALAITFFLILRLYGLGNILNAILITASVFTLEHYFTKTN